MTTRRALTEDPTCVAGLPEQNEPARLAPHRLDRAVLQEGSLLRLRRLFDRLRRIRKVSEVRKQGETQGEDLRPETEDERRERTLNIAVVGGSSELGYNVPEHDVWPQRVARWFAERFPGTDVRVRTSSFGAEDIVAQLRVIPRRVWEIEADLVFVALAVNPTLIRRWRGSSSADVVCLEDAGDGEGGCFEAEPPRKAFGGQQRAARIFRGQLHEYQFRERLVRSLLRLPARPPVILAEWFRWQRRPLGWKSYGLSSFEEEDSFLAKYYELPLVSVRSAVLHTKPFLGSADEDGDEDEVALGNFIGPVDNISVSTLL